MPAKKAQLTPGADVDAQIAQARRRREQRKKMPPVNGDLGQIRTKTTAALYAPGTVKKQGEKHPQLQQHWVKPDELKRAIDMGLEPVKDEDTGEMVTEYGGNLVLTVEPYNDWMERERAKSARCTAHMARRSKASDAISKSEEGELSKADMQQIQEELTMTQNPAQKE